MFISFWCFSLAYLESDQSGKTLQRKSQMEAKNTQKEGDWKDPEQQPDKSPDVHQRRHEKQTFLDEYQFPGRGQLWFSLPESYLERPA